jgi:hypothetical protein
MAVGMTYTEAETLVDLRFTSDLASGLPLLRPPLSGRDAESLPDQWESFVSVMQWATLTSPGLNLCAALAPAVAWSLGQGSDGAIAFRTCVSALVSGVGYGPFGSNPLHSCLLAAPLCGATARYGAAVAGALAGALAWVRALDRARARARESPDAFWNGLLMTGDFGQMAVELIGAALYVPSIPPSDAALSRVFLPSVPERMVLLHEATWDRLEQCFQSGIPNDDDHYAAAYLLLLDGFLWIAEVHEQPADSRFARLAELTQNVESPPLRLAHCIRDLAYGDESRSNELAKMVKSEDPAYRRMFEECLWRATPEEEARERREP